MISLARILLASLMIISVTPTDSAQDLPPVPQVIAKVSFEFKRKAYTNVAARL